ncbi:ABC transporter ATP-binding protein [Occallatibacter savannae]|uniref:ATP-binding cassette domain-containing protein n=1 Tax=Occallatibacter savannae TaxID=1002691 RepID=UPI0013A57697|nr:ABC transporter ATP-binding protein [Occallatibacter savannae]
MSAAPLLSLQISAGYAGRNEVLRDLSLDVEHGEILGLVGQSGCGKSTLALAIPRLLHMKNGTVRGGIRFNGRDLMGLRKSEMRKVRGKSIALVLQSPIASLNPALRICAQLEESWLAHCSGSSLECRRAIGTALENVSLDASRETLQKYPSELSVGQAQRVLIAMAVLHKPLLLIADEPTSALDAVTQSEVLELFSTLNRRFGMAILYISHDLRSVAAISSRIVAMADGRLTETADPERWLGQGTQSQALLAQR